TFPPASVRLRPTVLSTSSRTAVKSKSVEVRGLLTLCLILSVRPDIAAPESAVGGVAVCCPAAVAICRSFRFVRLSQTVPGPGPDSHQGRAWFPALDPLVSGPDPQRGTPGQRDRPRGAPVGGTWRRRHPLVLRPPLAPGRAAAGRPKHHAAA